MSSPCLRGNNKHNGFTLIELMVTMVIMAIIMALATMALSQFNGYVDKSGRGFDARINQYLSIERLRETIAQMSDYYVKNNLKKTVLFFEGTDEEVKFVSRIGWVEETPTLNWLAVENDEFDASLKALVLYQVSALSDPLFEQRLFPEKEDMKRYTILSGAREIRLTYLGIENFRQVYPFGTTDNFLKNLRWNGSYQGKDTGYLPNKIKVNIEWDDGLIWPSIFAVESFNLAKRTLMLDGAS